MDHNRQQDITTIMAEVANAVVGEFNIESLLDHIINTTMEVLHAEVCSIFLEDKESQPGVLKCVAGSGFAKNIVDIGEYKIGEGFTGSVAKHGGEYNIKSPKELQNLKIKGGKVWLGKYDPNQWEKGKNKFRNLIALRLEIKGQTLGVIKAENKIEDFGPHFSDEDAKTFNTIATVISLVIENARLVQKTETQAKRISSSLAEIASAIGQFDMQGLLDQISDTMVTILDAENCMIFLEDKEKEPGILKCVSASGHAKSILGVEYKTGEGFTGSIFESGLEFNLKSRAELESIEINGKKKWRGKFDNTQWKSGTSEYKNGIGLPLKIQDKILGVMKVENKKEECGDFFTTEDLTICRTIASVVALVIENTRLVQIAEDQSKRIATALSSVANAVVGKFNMGELLDQIINTTMVTLQADVCSIFLEDKEKEPGVLICVAGSGFAERIVGEKYTIGEGFTSYVFKSGQEFNLQSRKELENLKINGKKVWEGKFDNKQWKSGVSEFRNLIALPLKIQERTLGVIKAENKKKGIGEHFSDEDLTIFKTIANVVALTIENARLHDQIETQLKTISVKAAHRINNQAANYDGIELELLEEIEKTVPNKENLSQLHERLRKTTKGLKNMIGEFRSFGKPIVLQKTRCSINEIIQNEIWLARPEGLEIEEYLDPKIPDCNMDATRFAESVKELISNSFTAVKTKRSIGGKIRITSYISENGMVAIRIEDNGPGFPKNFPVFEPFNTTDPQGTGLGLATVKELIDAHQGKIFVDKSSLGGACIKITLPIT